MKTTMNRLLCPLCLALCFAASLHAEEAPKFIELQGHTDGVSYALSSPDGKKVLVFGGLVSVYDAESGKELYKLVDSVSGAKFSPNGKIIATHTQRYLQLWDAETGKELHKIDLDSPFCHDFSPKGNKIYARNYSGTGYRIWDVESGKELEYQGWHPFFSPDGTKMIDADFSRKTILVRDVDSWKILHTLEHAPWIRQSLFSPDGKKIITVNGGTVRIWTLQPTLTFIEFKIEIKEDRNEYIFANFSSDGKKICVNAGRMHFERGFVSRISVWDVESGKELYKLNEDNVSTADFSPDGKVIATFKRDVGAHIWDAESGKELRKIELPDNFSFFEYFLPDGKKIAATNHTFRIYRIWDIESGEELNFNGGLPVWSPDGAKLVSAIHGAEEPSNIVPVYDTDSWEVLHELKHEHPVWSAHFSPDGKKIITVGDDGVRIWTLPTPPAEPPSEKGEK